MNKITPPCEFFEKCGGCSFLDLSDQSYQEIKKQDLAQALAPISDYLPKPDYIWVGPKSRRKITLQIDIKNRLGFFAKKSNEVAEIGSCFVAEEEISKLILPLKNFIKNQEQNLFTQATLTLFDNGVDLVLQSKRALNPSQTNQLISFAKEHNLNASIKIKSVTPVFLSRKNQIFYPNFKINLNSDIFIQATKSGLFNIINIIRNFLSQDKKTKNVIDIYSGFGAYSFAIQDLVTKISSFEGDEAMVDLINKNAAQNQLANKIKGQLRDLITSPINAVELKDFDLAIINPPRNGATPQIKELSKSKVKNIIYVSCNPKTFAFDAKILIDSGFKITNLFVLDQFYSTNHLELVAIFQKDHKF